MVIFYGHDRILCHRTKRIPLYILLLIRNVLTAMCVLFDKIVRKYIEITVEERVRRRKI